ncbi:Tex family protein [Bacteroides xylanisolvens]|uniref:Tex family protein n=1 Tax=Bacteroides xylanisolvens TaxID=371601 RepID=UPI003260316B
MELFHKMISGFLGIPERQISSTLHLLGEGATIPFISRYRKEATGGLDEVQIEQIKEQHDKLCDIAKRKETILGTITEQGKLTAELEKRINDTWNPTELEDIYLPYKPKRKTRAEVARQKGLEPLATILLLQRENNLSAKAASFVKGEVKDVEDALKGARDIIAEQVNEDERARNAVRNQFGRQAEITAKLVKGKEEEAAKYRDYFDFSEPLKRCTSHRLLAIRRAESEGLLKVSINPDDEACIERLERQFVRGNNECSRQVGEAASKLRKMIEAYQIEAISIGNGTASRETEDFINSQSFDRQIPVFVVSEQGASIYSASKIARDEFPDYDVTVRGAVSIGRRLMDPLAELVKIDPKSIGVGQYQHDVDQTKLKKALDQTVENCVNLVGVNLNTASSHLLTYISGLGPQLAQNIVNYRAENGAFGSRKELMKVPRMGAKAFEQCAGFLRIPGAKNPLDHTAVHPESYHIVEQMAKDLKCTIDELIADKELRRKINISDYITPTVGLPTLQDILQELDKPGRDPRKAIKVFEFDKNVRTIADLREGMILPGIVGNITNFGAFVDIGIKENGLVHLSQLAERFISDPTEVVSIHQHVMVRVMNVDYDRKRIQLSMIGVPQD